MKEGPRTMLPTLPERYQELCRTLNQGLCEPAEPSTNGTNPNGSLSPEAKGSPAGSQNPRWGWRPLRVP